MLRLRPSSIVLTHDEVSKVLEKPCPPASRETVSFTGSLPWDHNITVRRLRRKGKQKASIILDQDILFDFQGLSINQDEDGYNGGAEEDVGDGDEGSITAGSVIDGSSPVFFQSFDAGPLNEEDSNNITTVLDTSPSYKNVRLSPAHIDGSFSFDDFEPSNWEIYEDPGTLSETGENYDLNDSNYLADVEQDFSEASDYQGNSGGVELPEHLPLRPLVTRHLDGAAETEVIEPVVVDEDSQFSYNSGPAHALPLPNSVRLHSRTLGHSRLEEYRLLHETTTHSTSVGHGRHTGPRLPWHSPGITRSMEQGGMSPGPAQDGNDLGFRRRYTSSNDWLNNSVVEDLSDDSLSGIQLPPDTVWELEERKQRRQAEAAKRIIR